MGMEFELKYRADAAALSRIREALAGQAQLYEMQTTYYDTLDGSFSSRKWTLRRRMENGRSVCTLKTPAAGHGRQEWEVDCGDIEAAIPMLCKLGCPEALRFLAAQGLQPICGARFTRTAKTLSHDGAVLEVAMDSGILYGGGREMPLCELEVELKSGPEEVCVAFAQTLARQYGLTPEPLSKFRRALDLYKGV